MIEALGEAGGKVVILDYKDAESCLLRVEGFHEVIAKHNEGRTNGRIEIVAELPGDGKKEVGYKAAEDALQAHADPIRHPDQIGIITAQSIVKYLEGEELKKEQLIPTKLYRQADALADPELKESR